MHRHPALPEGSEVISNCLDDSLPVVSRGEDLFIATLPSGVQVGIGWWPPCEDDGSYFISVYDNSGALLESPAETKDLSVAVSELNDLARRYGDRIVRVEDSVRDQGAPRTGSAASHHSPWEPLFHGILDPNPEDIDIIADIIATNNLAKTSARRLQSSMKSAVALLAIDIAEFNHALIDSTTQFIGASYPCVPSTLSVPLVAQRTRTPTLSASTTSSKPSPSKTRRFG